MHGPVNESMSGCHVHRFKTLCVIMMNSMHGFNRSRSIIVKSVGNCSIYFGNAKSDIAGTHVLKILYLTQVDTYNSVVVCPQCEREELTPIFRSLIFSFHLVRLEFW